MSTQEHPATLTDTLRRFTGGILNRLGTRLYQLGIHPDMLTVAGLILVACGELFHCHWRVANRWDCAADWLAAGCT